MADDYFEKTMADIAESVDTVYEKESVESVVNRRIYFIVTIGYEKI